MNKNIILCSDGTGNTAVKGRGTNVFKLFEAIDLTEYRTNPALPAQLAFYDDGVGTQGIAPIKVLGGATGLGLAHNVKKLYRELSRVYDPGDAIFLFGFSRGAFTVRTLAGMAGKCGVLKGGEFKRSRDLREAVDAAYAKYRWNYKSHLTDWFASRIHTAQPPPPIDPNMVHAEVPIRFIGVWDTVDAVGMPFALAETINTWIVQFKFRTQTLGDHVEHAYHALSLDDDRSAFAPVLWHAKKNETDARIHQVWFAGVHSNVGGGYPKQGMSLIALEWMLRHAAEHGLSLQQVDLDLFRAHASVDDMMYEPRAGFGIFYRWSPRDVVDYCAKSGFTPRLHMSVAERIAHGTDDYAPGNIPPHVAIAFTPADVTDPKRDFKDALMQMRAEALERAIHTAIGNNYLLDDVRDRIFYGDISYWIFMVAWLCFAFAGVGVVANLAGHAFRWGWWATIGAIGLIAAWQISVRVDDKMEDKFSQFWQKHHRDLRLALKAVRDELRRSAGTTRASSLTEAPTGVHLSEPPLG